MSFCYVSISLGKLHVMFAIRSRILKTSVTDHEYCNKTRALNMANLYEASVIVVQFWQCSFG